MMLLMLLVAGCIACEKGIYDTGDAPGDNVERLSHEMIVLGDKLEDPYTVANMTKALNTLYPSRAGTSSLRATHLYVRFLPRDRSEYARLDSMGVVLYDHPLQIDLHQRLAESAQQGKPPLDIHTYPRDVHWQRLLHSLIAELKPETIVISSPHSAIKDVTQRVS